MTGGQVDWTVMCGGHSLGGALATLMAVEAGKGLGYKSVALYTMGSPRVGERDFVKSVHESVPERWRIRNVRDIVATLPITLPFVGIRRYKHVMPGLQLDQLERRVLKEG